MEILINILFFLGLFLYVANSKKEEHSIAEAVVVCVVTLAIVTPLSALLWYIFMI